MGRPAKGFIYFLPTRNFYVMVFGWPIGTFAVLAALRAAKEPSCQLQKHTPKNSWATNLLLLHFFRANQKGKKKMKNEKKQAAPQLVLINGSTIRIIIKVDFKFRLRNTGPPQIFFCVSPCIQCKPLRGLYSRT